MCLLPFAQLHLMLLIFLVTLVRNWEWPLNSMTIASSCFTLSCLYLHSHGLVYKSFMVFFPAILMWPQKSFQFVALKTVSQSWSVTWVHFQYPSLFLFPIKPFANLYIFAS
jgi:hypothetical protein